VRATKIDIVGCYRDLAWENISNPKLFGPRFRRLEGEMPLVRCDVDDEDLYIQFFFMSPTKLLVKVKNPNEKHSDTEILWDAMQKLYRYCVPLHLQIRNVNATFSIPSTVISKLSKKWKMAENKINKIRIRDRAGYEIGSLSLIGNGQIIKSKTVSDLSLVANHIIEQALESVS